MINEKDIDFDDKKFPFRVQEEKKVKSPIKPKIDMKKCKQCMLCVTLCPYDAIKIKNDKPNINYNFCKGCLICLRQCPWAAIEEVE